MRIHAAVAVMLVSACGRPVFDGFDDDTKPIVVRQRIDPCVWDGGGLGYCHAVYAEAFNGRSCVAACSSPGQQPGFFGVGQCRSFCLDIDPCDGASAGTRDAGVVTGWVFDESRCIPVGGTYFLQPNVFETRSGCERTCGCDTSKFEGAFSADCDVEITVAPRTIPPVPSFHLEGDRYLAEQRGLRSMKEMCRIGRAPNVLKVRCEREE